VNRPIEEYVRGLGLDAYVVGGAVRDELLGIEPREADFLAAGVDHAALRAALEPHGKVEDLVVAGQRVGLRLFPREGEIRALAPVGIEFTPPRAERSTGPGRHDFEIVTGADISVEEDMARRDFTINAIALRLADGTIVDPFDGRRDLERGVLRTVGERSFAEDPLRLVRALRFVSQLGFEPDPTMLEQMRDQATSIALVSAERIGGGLRADGLGELSKLLLGSRPQRALRLARDTGVLVELLPPYRDAIGRVLESPRQPLPLEEHMFAVVQAAADAGDPLPVRLAALLHDLGKPHASEEEHAALGAEIAAAELRRLRYPNRLQAYVTALVREHAFQLHAEPDPPAARRFLRRHGDELASDLIRHKRADLAAKDVGAGERDRLERFWRLLEQERTSPHRVADLAIDGGDLLSIGYREGPELGRALETLLDAVVEDPALNERQPLLDRAANLLVTR
jgi:poly(A) polymerase/tRNA nucleotidyltransferase (CCA-adding enzyme)